MEAAPPFSGPETDDAPHHLGSPLEHHQYSSDWNHRLELIDRRTLRRYGRMLADGPRFRRGYISRVNECRDSGDEEDDIEHQIEAGLKSRPHRTIEEVAAHMGVLRQRVSAGEHEQRAVKHVVEVEYPCRGRVQDVALEHLNTDDGHQCHDQPRRGLSDPGADAVDRVQDALDVHPLPPLTAEN